MPLAFPGRFLPSGIIQTGDQHVRPLLTHSGGTVLDAVGLPSNRVRDLQVAILVAWGSIAVAGEVPARHDRPILERDTVENRVISHRWAFVAGIPLWGKACFDGQQGWLRPIRVLLER